MDANKLFNKFPILENTDILLRPVIESDLEFLFNYLNEEDIIKEYSSDKRYTDLKEVHSDFIYYPKANFDNWAQIMWAIIDKKSNKIIGIRDCWFDAVDKPVTIQGFISKNQRNKGFSKSAYNLILNFLNACSVENLIANTSSENFAAISLLYSMGFYQTEISTLLDDNYNETWRIVFEKNIQNPINNKQFDSFEEKRLYIFCKMLLNANEIQFDKNHNIACSGFDKPTILVSLKAIQTFNYNYQIGEMKFISDGIKIIDLGNSGYIGYLNEEMKLISTWLYCWDCCKKINKE